jgi:hypothetical protein
MEHVDQCIAAHDRRPRVLCGWQILPIPDDGFALETREVADTRPGKGFQKLAIPVLSGRLADILLDQGGKQDQIGNGHIPKVRFCRAVLGFAATNAMSV